MDRLEQAIDELIVATRSAPTGAVGVSDLSSVVSARCSFWAVLAEEQRRVMTLNVDDHGPVDLSREAVEAVVDALIGNVFSHTEPGTPFDVTLGSDGGRPWLEVSDHGPGFASRRLAGARCQRGWLDRARARHRPTDRRIGGWRMEMNDRPGGGAVVRVWLGPSRLAPAPVVIVAACRGPLVVVVSFIVTTLPWPLLVVVIVAVAVTAVVLPVPESSALSPFPGPCCRHRPGHRCSCSFRCRPRSCWSSYRWWCW